MKRVFVLIVLFLLVSVALFSSSVHADSGTFLVRVLDDGVPVDNAFCQVVDWDQTMGILGWTNSSGYFPATVPADGQYMCMVVVEYQGYNSTWEEVVDGYGEVILDISNATEFEFVQPEFTVVGSGSIIPDPEGPYGPGQNITLTAIPTGGASFLYWIRVVPYSNHYYDNPHTFTGLISGEIFTAVFTFVSTPTPAPTPAPTRAPNPTSTPTGKFPFRELPNMLNSLVPMGTFVAGLLLTMVALALILVPIMVLTKGKQWSLYILVGLTVLGGMVALGWFPVWFMIVIILAIALGMGQKIADALGGNKGER